MIHNLKSTVREVQENPAQKGAAERGEDQGSKAVKGSPDSRVWPKESEWYDLPPGWPRQPSPGPGLCGLKLSLHGILVLPRTSMHLDGI